MDWDSLGLQIILTAVAYMAFPIIKLLINNGKFEKNAAHKISLWNSIVLGTFFLVVTSIALKPGNAWSATPAIIYYFVNRAILTNKTTDQNSDTQDVCFSTPRKKYDRQKIITIVSIILNVIFILAIIGNNLDAHLSPVAEPKSGQLLTGSEPISPILGSNIKITAAPDSACVVKLKTRTGIERMSFYVRAGDTVTVSVPLENLYVYFASGDTWYGTAYLFGKDTKYIMDNQLCNFAEHRLEYTPYYSVSDGNFKKIREEDFR